MKKLKLAFIGGGLNSAIGTTHKIASQMDNKFELAAGCFSSEEETNEQTAKSWSVDRAYSNWKELLEREKSKIDAITILTPTPDHTEIVLETIKLGYPVICEKALTTSVCDALRIKKSLKEFNGYLAVTYNYTGYPMVRELKSIIKEGKIGRVRQIHMEMPQEAFAKLDKNGNYFKPQEWRLHDADISTISLDLGVHIHSMIHFMVNERPIKVVAVQDSLGFFKQVIDNVMCIAEYTNNIICNIWYSKVALGDNNGFRIRVYGEKGSAQWYQMNPEILHLHNDKGQMSIIDRGGADVNISSQTRYGRFKAGHPAGFIEAFANLYSDIADSIIAYKKRLKYKSEYVAGIDEAMEGLYMLEAIAKSAKSESWEKIEGKN